MAETDVVPKHVSEDSGKLGAAGLALKWDNNASVRHRLREGWNLVVHYDTKVKKQTNFKVEHTIANVKANFFVLEEVCHLINHHGRFPDIESLEHEVRQVLSLYNAKVTSSTITSQSWAIRHLLTVLRGTVRPPKQGRPSGYSRCPKDHGLRWKCSNLTACLKGRTKSCYKL